MLDSIVAAVTVAEPRCGHTRIVAIDGGAASGKSTLADRLADALGRAHGAVPIVHTDDLLDGWAGQFTFWDRLRGQVLVPLGAGTAGRFHRYDWIARAFTDWVDVPVGETLIVEGVSAIEACAGYLSTAIFLDVDRPERERRWADRNGPLRPHWRTWLDAEDRYFATHALPAGTITVETPGF